MKNVKKYSLLLAMSGLFIAALVGCSKEEDKNPTPSTDENPSVTIVSPSSNITVEAGATVNFKVTATANSTSNSALASVKAIVSYNGGAVVSGSIFSQSTIAVGDTAFTSTLATYTLQRSAEANSTAGTEIWTFTTTDAAGKTGSASITITTTAQTALSIQKTGYFYHILGSLKGAYDLVADTVRGSSEADADKDFINTDVAGNFDGTWRAGNTTTFVKAPGYPTFNAQLGSPSFAIANLDSIYKAGTPITFSATSGTGSGYVYIAKLRGGSKYAVVKFMSIVEPNNDCSCANTGKTEFVYWK